MHIAFGYGPVGALLIVGAGFAIVTIIAAYVLRPADAYEEKLLTYECGIPPTGDAWSSFFVRYYVVALIFVIFDVETIFLYPWAVVYRQLMTAPRPAGLYPLGEMVVFILLLLLGLGYAWRKGDLEWA